MIVESAHARLLVIVACVSCGTDVATESDTITARIQWHQVPGEIQDCHVFKLSNQEPAELDHLQITFPEGSHHVHVYRASTPQTDGVFDCFSGIDFTTWSLLIGAQTKSMDWTLPEGVTMPIDAHQQLLVQVHWLDTTDHDIDPTIDLAFHKAQSSTQHLGVLFGVNKRIDIPPGATAHVEDWCGFPDSELRLGRLNLLAIMGHFHQHGRDYRVTERAEDETGGTTVYEAPDESAFQFQIYDPPHRIALNAGLDYECSYFNFSPQTITWGSDTKRQEHCNMTAYYYPATTLSTLCLLESYGHVTLRPQQPAVAAGATVTFDVELEKPAPKDFAIALTASDPTALDVPPSVTIAAGATRAAFLARALKPAPVVVTAMLEGATATARISVSGLELSEVFYRPATASPTGLQWIELANRTDEAIDLASYSIGAGQADYLATRIDLPLSIAPHGCVVIGGPISSPDNHSPTLALATAFSPALGLGGAQASGVALFAVPAAQLTSSTTPVDAVVHSGTNASLRGPDGELAPAWPSAPAGGSLRRVTSSGWATTSAPTPGACEVLGG